jgi:hypothetical protein
MNRCRLQITTTTKIWEWGGIMEATNNLNLALDSQESALGNTTNKREWQTPEFHRMDLSTARGSFANETPADGASFT